MKHGTAGFRARSALVTAIAPFRVASIPPVVALDKAQPLRISTSNQYRALPDVYPFFLSERVFRQYLSRLPFIEIGKLYCWLAAACRDREWAWLPLIRLESNTDTEDPRLFLSVFPILVSIQGVSHESPQISRMCHPSITSSALTPSRYPLVPFIPSDERGTLEKYKY